MSRPTSDPIGPGVVDAGELAVAIREHGNALAEPGAASAVAQTFTGDGRLVSSRNRAGVVRHRLFIDPRGPYPTRAAILAVPRHHRQTADRLAGRLLASLTYAIF